MILLENRFAQKLQIKNDLESILGEANQISESVALTIYGFYAHKRRLKFMEYRHNVLLPWSF